MLDDRLVRDCRRVCVPCVPRVRTRTTSPALCGGPSSSVCGAARAVCPWGRATQVACMYECDRASAAERDRLSARCHDERPLTTGYWREQPHPPAALVSPPGGLRGPAAASSGLSMSTTSPADGRLSADCAQHRVTSSLPRGPRRARRVGGRDPLLGAPWGRACGLWQRAAAAPTIVRAGRSGRHTLLRLARRRPPPPACRRRCASPTAPACTPCPAPPGRGRCGQTGSGAATGAATR